MQQPVICAFWVIVPVFFLSICSLFDLGTEGLKGDANLTEILKLFMGALHVLCYVLKSFTVDFLPNVFHGLL